MVLPYPVDKPRIVVFVVAGDEGTVGGGEGKGPGFVEHLKELDARGTDESAVDSGFVFALSFAKEDDGLHGSNTPAQCSPRRCIFLLFSVIQ